MNSGDPDNATTEIDYGPGPGSLAAVTGGTVFDIDAFLNNPTAVLNALTASCVATALPANICGTKYNDLNGNSTRNSNEPGLPNWQIVATDGADSYSATTDSSGDYCVQVPAGTYTVSEVQQSPWVQTAPATPGTHSITVQQGQTVNNIDFGNRFPNVTVRGHKFWDLNGNGVRDQISQIPGVNIQEPLLDGFTFRMYRGDWNYVAGPVTVNSANQGYVFTDIPPGDYFIVEDAVAGWTQTAPISNNGAQVFTVNGQHISGLDFGNRPCLSSCDGYIMGFKFRDSNYNGVWDDSEANHRQGGVTIELLDAAGNIVQTTTTDSTGLYYFLDVTPGTYTVREQIPPGWMQTVPGNNGGVHTVTISPGNNGIGLNFGNYRCTNRIIAEPDPDFPNSGSAGRRTVPTTVPTIIRPKGCVIGTKFNDENENDIRDNGEGPLEGFKFTLQSVTNPANTQQATSDAYGNFRFVVLPGVYTLSEIGQTGWTLTTPDSNEYMVTVTESGIVSGFEFGNYLCTPKRGSKDTCERDIKIYTTPPRLLTVGQKATYTLKVQNVGRYATTAPTTVYFSLPSGTTLAEKGWSGRGWSCTSGYSFVRCVQRGSIKSRYASML